MAEITVQPLGGSAFKVTVIDSGGSTVHRVGVGPETLNQLGWTSTPEELIRRSFEFLLAREGKESILREFDLSDIGRYFPDYEASARAGFH